MKRNVLLLLLIAVSWQLNLAQKTITGTVRSAEDNSVLPGVNVLVKGTTAGLVTNSNGQYRLEVPDEAEILVFSFVGMKSEEIAINGQTIIDVLLQPDVTDLEEVVVVGYGTTIKTELTGAISKVSANDLQQVPNTTFESSLQGKTSGVLMTSTSGKLGEAFNIRVRGVSSISASNQPLYVIDGMILASTDFGDPANQPLNPLVTLDPNDIESIQVLKDASAAAIYGSRGSNGVVIITTKSGKNKSRSSVNFGYSLSARKETNRIDMLNGPEYVELLGEAAENVDFFGDENYGPGDREQFIRDYFFYERDTVNTDWQDYMFKKKAISHEAFLNVTGGNDNSSYFAGVSYSDQEGILIKNNFTRANARLNYDHTVSKYFDISTKINYAQTTLDRVANDNAFATPVQLIAQAPITPAYLEDGEPNPEAIYFNGLIAAKYNKNQTNTNRTITNLSANLHFIPKMLTLTTMVAIDNFNQREEERESFKTDDGQPAGKGSYRVVQNLSMSFDNYLTFEKNLNDVHNINAVAGISYQEEKYTRGTMGGKTFPSDDFQDLDAASENWYFGTLNSQTSFLSYFARANYKLDNKYLLSLSFRRDGSSRFGEDARFGNFYAFSAGWLVTKESFMQNIQWLSFLKPRISYGETGNAGIPDYGYMNLVNSKHYAGQTGFYAWQIGKANLKWEKTDQLDLGLDYGFLNNKISGEIDIYSKKTSDMLLSRSIPMTTGYVSIYENVGAMENKGIEFIINATPISGNFVWNVNFNITYNQNKVTKLIEPLIFEQNRVEVGKPLGFFYMPEYAGADPANGDALYYTATGETTNDYSLAEFKDVGNPNPKYFGGFTNSFSFKGFDLNIFLQYVQDVDLYRMHGIYMSNNAAGLDNQTKDQLDRWQKPGDVTDVPQARLGEDNGGRMSSRYIEDGSYIRLKDVTLGYTLPKTITEKIYIQSLRLYVSGLNLAIITKYSGWDPEVSSTGINRTQSAFNVEQGVEYYPTPQAKGLTFGLNVTF
jgi:TonB-linked SusC/RagA family outer membrane protein